MLGRWTVDWWPTLEFDVFLSHCAEDRKNLVRPVYRKLIKHRLNPWIDRDHYPRGLKSFDALRWSLLRCRHVVYFITPSLLKQGRGWCASERSFGDLIQRQFEFATTNSVPFWTYEIPLLFIEKKDERLVRSCWGALSEKASCYSRRPNSSQSRIDWAIAEIKAAIQQQRATSSAVSSHINSDNALQYTIAQHPGFMERLLSRLPDPRPTKSP